MQAIAERTGISTQGLTAAQIEGALGREIERHGQPCLWVVDDVPNRLDGETLRRWFAPHPLARTLITTRSREYGSLAKGIDLPVLVLEEAYQLLTSRKQPIGDAEKEQALLLAEDLGRHALALDVTASALQHSVADAPFANFRAKLARPDKDALILAETLADALPNGHEKSIAQTMLRSIRSLGTEGQEFLRLASMLALAPIPASLFTAVLVEADNLSREEAEERASLAFKQVTSASLAEKAGEHLEARAVHTLVSRTMRFQQMRSPERTEALREAAVGVLLAEIAKAAEDPRLHKQIEFHVAHARQLVAMPATVAEANLIALLALFDHERGDYASARLFRERELDFRRRTQGLEQSDTLESMHNLARTILRQGGLLDALKLNEETLAIRQRILGPEHRDTVSSMTNVANSHWALGHLPEATKIEAEALAIARRTLGLADRETLVLMNNRAETLRRYGDLHGARKLLEETLQVQCDVLGPNHPHVLVSMNNLALVLKDLQDLEGARKLEEDAFETRRRIMPLNHPDTLNAMSNLAETLRAQGKLAKARELQENTLGIRSHVLGQEHPNTLKSMRHLAEIMLEQGDLISTRKLAEEAHTIQSRVLGRYHSDTIQSAWILLEVCQKLDDTEAVRSILDRDLMWLLHQDPATLDAGLRKIRSYLAQETRDG
jgi:hypothetical protein